MKKALLTLVLIIAVVASAAAGQAVSLYGSPYSFLYIDSSAEVFINSSYGFGGMLDYRVNPVFGSNFFVGASTGIQEFEMSEFDIPDYTNFFVKANAGYNFHVTDDLTVSPYFSLGLDVAHLMETSNYFACGPALNLALRLQGSVDLTADISGSFSFPNTTEYQFAISRLNIFVGVTYKF